MKRARSAEEKEKKQQKIMLKGEELFLQKGAEGFGMRELAKEVKMTVGNLYNYYQSKRELWFAIINKYFDNFGQQMEEVVKKHKGSLLELLDKLAELYLEFAISDIRRYQMMFVTPAPPAGGEGPNELICNPVTLSILHQIVEEAIEKKEIKEQDSKMLTSYLWAILHGSVMIYYSTKETEEVRLVKDPREFHEYVRKKL
ncbi:MAG: TetR/AcrR family transcriptional regulator, partial [Candidatus Kariarchaeaceae archaeon]